VSEEIENPARNVPRALILGVLLLIALYVGANVAYHVTLPAATIAKSPNPAAAVCAVLLPGFGEPLLLSMLLVSLLGALNSNILVGPRVLFAVGRDYPALEPLAEISESGKTPAWAIVAMAVWSSTLIVLAVLIPQLDTPLYEILTSYCIFGGSIFYFFAVLAVFVLRIRQPNRERPYRTWGYPVVPALFVAFYVVFLGTMLWGQPRQSGFGLILIALGAVVYGLIVKIQARER
jgi:APA family basic amino acid/polyamine antiporter